MAGSFPRSTRAESHRHRRCPRAVGSPQCPHTCRPQKTASDCFAAVSRLRTAAAIGDLDDSSSEKRQAAETRHAKTPHKGGVCRSLPDSTGVPSGRYRPRNSAEIPGDSAAPDRTAARTASRASAVEWLATATEEDIREAVREAFDLKALRLLSQPLPISDDV